MKLLNKELSGMSQFMLQMLLESKEGLLEEYKASYENICKIADLYRKEAIAARKFIEDGPHAHDSAKEYFICVERTKKEMDDDHTR